MHECGSEVSIMSVLRVDKFPRSTNEDLTDLFDRRLQAFHVGVDILTNTGKDIFVHDEGSRDIKHDIGGSCVWRFKAYNGSSERVREVNNLCHLGLERQVMIGLVVENIG